MNERLPATADTIDVADVARTIRRQWRALATCVVLGLALALAVVLFAPRKFDGRALVLAKAGGGGGGSISGRMSGGLGELLGGLGGLGLGGTLETELQLLKSRQLVGQVVDSLQLQLRVRDPAGTPVENVVASSRFPGIFAPKTYDFERAENGSYRAEVGDSSYELTPGREGALDAGVVTLRPGTLPASFQLRVLDREDAVDRFTKSLTATKAGGDIVRIVYRGDDSVSAASAANTLIKFYLDRRKDVDRGVNARRVEYVSGQLDSVARDLARSERELRQYQESSEVLDAAVVGEVELTAAAEMRAEVTALQVEEAALKQLLALADSGRITARDLAANPSFVRGAAVSPLFNQLNDLEAQRIRLLDRRTARDPDVLAIDSTMAMLQANVVAVTRNYTDAITRQRRQMQSRLDSIQAKLMALPAAAERGGRLQRDVLRQSAIYTALEAQLIEARLGAIGEGGDAKQIDLAVTQRKPSFPRPVLTMGIGGAGGLLAGVIAAMMMGWFGRWLRDPVEIERAIGVNAQRIEADAPLLLANASSSRSLLVVPLDRLAHAGAGTVAERLARTAGQRAGSAQLLDLSGSQLPSGNGASPGHARVSDVIAHKEQEGVVVVRLPELSSEVTLAALRETRPVLLVAAPGPVDRARLSHAVNTLRLLQVPCAGVVISDAPRARALA